MPAKVNRRVSCGAFRKIYMSKVKFGTGNLTWGVELAFVQRYKLRMLHFIS